MENTWIERTKMKTKVLVTVGIIFHRIDKQINAILKITIIVIHLHSQLIFNKNVNEEVRILNQ